MPLPSISKALVDAVGADNADLIVKGKKPVVASCGSGMTAAVLWLGLKLLGAESIGLYDEVRFISEKERLKGFTCWLQSWTGYASRKESKIDKGL